MFKSDVLGQAIWGGLLGMASGIAALVAMMTKTDNFPMFMTCHYTFARFQTKMRDFLLFFWEKKTVVVWTPSELFETCYSVIIACHVHACCTSND